jgi:hypothetical protein
MHIVFTGGAGRVPISDSLRLNPHKNSCGNASDPDQTGLAAPSRTVRGRRRIQHESNPHTKSIQEKSYETLS